MKLRFRNRIQQVVDEFAIFKLIQHFHCRLRRRLQPRLLLIVYHQKELPRRLQCLRIPIGTTRFTSKCHPSGAHPNPTNTQ
jgi:hypothetical protein